VQGFSRGGEGVAANPSAVGGVRRVGHGVRIQREVWRLDLRELRWERMSDLGCERCDHACCAVRGGVVVLGGEAFDEEEVDELGEAVSTDMEVLRSSDSEVGEEHTFTDLPPLPCGPRLDPIALPIDESESAEGLVLLLGGRGEDGAPLDVASRVLTVDLATGACTPHPPLLYGRWGFAAARRVRGRPSPGGHNGRGA
jgi:hypothetical protein